MSNNAQAEEEGSWRALVSVPKDSPFVTWGLPVVGTLSLFLFWIAVTDIFSILDSYIYPSPLEIYSEFQRTSGLIIDNIWPTVIEAGVGFLAALIVSLALAVVFTLSKRIKEGLMPLVVSMNSVPRISLAPLLIFYLGGIQAKYVIAAWIAFFPIFINVFEGLGNLDEDLELLLESLNPTLIQEFKWVRFPNALPFIFDGMKTGVTLAVVGAIVGEYVAAEAGLGWLVLFAMGEFQIALALGIVAIMGVISTMAFLVLFVAQDKLIHWEETSLLTE